MSRIDITTLVLAFEKRIEALEKNPPDKVPTSVIINMLESSIDGIITGHFLESIKKDLELRINEEFKKMRKSFINKTVKNILSSDQFRVSVEESLKQKMIYAIEAL